LLIKIAIATWRVSVVSENKKTIVIVNGCNAKDDDDDDDDDGDDD